MSPSNVALKRRSQTRKRDSENLSVLSLSRISARPLRGGSTKHKDGWISQLFGRICPVEIECCDIEQTAPKASYVTPLQLCTSVSLK
jgi:hypothetical protein